MQGAVPCDRISSSKEIGGIKVKLRAIKRSDRPHPTAYALTIGSAEAKKSGLIGTDGELYEIQKDVLPGVVIIRRLTKGEPPWNIAQS